MGPSKPGFSLVEILVAILLASIVMGAVVGLVFTFTYNFDQNVDMVSTRQRAEMTFSILRKAVPMTSLGIPNAPTDFQACFSENSVLGNWDQALNVIASGEILEMVYAVPTGIAVAEEPEFDEGVSLTLSLTGDPTSFISTDSSRSDGWVTFPSTHAVFRVDSVSGNTVTLTPKGSGTIAFFDEIHVVRAMRVQVTDTDTLVAEDPTTGEGMGTVEGIGGIAFVYDSGSRTLDGRILARGNSRYDDLISPTVIPDWPGVVPSEELRHYRLSVLRNTWRVRN